MFILVLTTSKGWQMVTETKPATKPQKNSLSMTVVVSVIRANIIIKYLNAGGEYLISLSIEW